jgi:hypothetical protein
MEIRIIMSMDKNKHYGISIYVNNQDFNINIIPFKKRLKLMRLLDKLTNYIQYLNKQGF